LLHKLLIESRDSSIRTGSYGPYNTVILYQLKSGDIIIRSFSHSNTNLILQFEEFEGR
jgi:hypothetical protein